MYLLTYMLIIFYLFYLTSNPILLDSPDIISNIIQEDLRINNNIDDTNNDIMIPVPLTKLGRIKRRIAWHWFGHSREKFDHYKDFKNSWDNSFSFRTTLKSEWKDLCHNPCQFIKEQSILIKKRKSRYISYLDNIYKTRRP